MQETRGGRKIIFIMSLPDFVKKCAKRTGGLRVCTHLKLKSNLKWSGSKLINVQWMV